MLLFFIVLVFSLVQQKNNKTMDYSALQLTNEMCLVFLQQVIASMIHEQADM